MQLNLIGGAFIAVGFLFVSCGEVSFSLEQNAKEQFKKLPGTIGITLQNYEATWRLRISMGQISRVDTLPRAQKEARSSRIEVYKGAPHLPEVDGHYYSGPYAISPDKRFIIASLTAKGTTPIYPTAFVIADYSRGQIVSETKQTGNYTISGVAWAPDSKLIAILKAREYSKWWQPFDIISYIVGHPIAHMEFDLDVLDLNTKTVAHTVLVKDLPSASGEVVWTEMLGDRSVAWEEIVAINTPTIAVPKGLTNVIAKNGEIIPLIKGMEGYQSVIQSIKRNAQNLRESQR